MIKKQLIICPKCGREHMVGEIYIPKYFIGQPTNVIRLDNKIVSFDGSDMDLNEEYICENCDTKFKVKATVSFETEEVKDLFDEDF